ncbi:MAG: ROK family protein [Clostridia bacterium]|nr:ROK family protein [Clostridia bacterium]
MYYIGIDLGGTNIKGGIVDPKTYNIICKKSVPTPKGEENIADAIKELIDNLLKESNLNLDDIEFMGLGSPGTVNLEKGIIEKAENVGFHETNLKELMAKRIDKKFYFDNDANAAAYGEAVAGAGKGCSHFVMITLGTGVGGGIIIDGEIYGGFSNCGAEVGHMLIKSGGNLCSCGRHGCWEAYASVTALISLTKEKMLLDKDSIMWEICEGDIEKVNGLTSFDGMRKGDKTACEVVSEYIENVSCGIVNLIIMLQPQVLCIGGAISKEKNYLLDPVLEYYEREKFTVKKENDTIIKTATLGGDAGIIGAAFLGTQKNRYKND